MPLHRPHGPWAPLRSSSLTLVEQLVQHLAEAIRGHGLRAGMRLPSVRQMAQDAGVSRSTVVQSYDRLVAQGLVVSRRGAGFFVRSQTVQAAPAQQPAVAAGVLAPAEAFDTTFLLRSMFREARPGEFAAGAGLLPPSWGDLDMLATAMRAVGRQMGPDILSYGLPQGYGPLRQQIAATLQSQDVPAHAERNVMTVAGVTQGLDLIVRRLVRPGETVLVEDPGWFVIFGRLRAAGIQVLGVPRHADGPDLQALARLAEQHRPKLFILNTAVHNPTGATLSAGVAYEVLRIAERFDMVLVEDDTYADFHPGTPVRLASLDRLQRVLLIGGYSKTLAGSLRVAYVAGHATYIHRLVDQKLLGGLTSPQMGEQIVHHILADGQYRRHVDKLRLRVDRARSVCLRALEDLDCRAISAPQAGMFVWVDCAVDTEQLARRAAAKGLLLAPGLLFSPSQRVSAMLRVSVSMVGQKQAWLQLSESLTELRQMGASTGLAVSNA